MPSNQKTPLRCLLAALLLGVLIPPTRAETQSLETLLAYLKSPTATTRREAAKKLGERRVRDPLAVDALAVAARRDEAGEVRAEAMKSLGLIKDISALPDMLDGLKDGQKEVRGITVRSLVALYTEHDIDFITNQRKGWNRLNPFIDTDDHEIIEPYINVEPSIVSALGDTARSDLDREVRISAIRALGVLRGRAAIPSLADALNADQNVRIDAIRTFIKIGDPESGRFLVPFFRDSDEKIRNQAMFATGYLKYRGAVQPLLSVYGRGPETRGAMQNVKNVFSPITPRDRAALAALAMIGDDRAEQVFLENLTDKNAERRQYAVEGLARIGDQKYADQISRLLLTEKNNDAKLAEQWALYKLGQREQIRFIVPKLYSGQDEQAYGYLMEINSVTDLYPYARSSNLEVRRKVIEILGKIGDKSTIAELQPVATSSSAETADMATVAIKRIEWRIAGRPRASDEVLRKQTRPRRAANP
ncbi:MAG: HEAT repeat domain-containing protein [Acidobacteria bacterium]|nr:HEAT repeat domain-containing protein [Acidobacteriota bacterium]